MAQMLTRMERDGVIQRTPDPADGRSSRITLTRPLTPVCLKPARFCSKATARY